MNIPAPVRAAACLVCGVAAAGGALAETPVGSNVDSRVILAFDAPDDAVAAWLPEGWTPVQMPGGPLAGADLLLVLIDRHVSLGPDGAPADPPASLSSALVTLATKEGESAPRMYVLRQYEEAPVGDAYGTSLPAELEHEAELEVSDDGARKRSEEWEIETEGGGAIRLEMSYAAGTPGWAPGEMRPYSAARPDFHRIYRYRQLVDVAMSGPMGKALDGEMEFSVSIDELAPLFDGTETLVGAMVIPVYVREVSLP